MDVIVREYRSGDHAAVALLMEELQQYIAAIDPLKRNRCEPHYGQSYIDHLLEGLKDTDGICLVALADHIVVGCIVVTIDPQSDIDLLGEFPLKDAQITELIVSASIRSKGVGTLLMEEAEDYARKQDCTCIRTVVFSPNIDAYRFYQQLGYADRCVDVLKVLRSFSGS